MSNLGSAHKKAGARDQVLGTPAPINVPRQPVPVMDADCSLRQGFTGKPGGGFVDMFQRNEYGRYPRDIASDDNSAELRTDWR